MPAPKPLDQLTPAGKYMRIYRENPEKYNRSLEANRKRVARKRGRKIHMLAHNLNSHGHKNWLTGRQKEICMLSDKGYDVGRIAVSLMIPVSVITATLEQRKTLNL